MADPVLVDLLGQGVEAWNEHKPTLSRRTMADLAGADLHGLDLSGAELSGVNLARANLAAANLRGANLAVANLQGANMREADLRGGILFGAQLPEANLRAANLEAAILIEASLVGANLLGANLSRANLDRASLSHANLTFANLDGANLSGSSVFGINVWDVEGEPAGQESLVITPYGTREVTVDNLKVAQFVYLLMSNKEISNVIDTITSRVVLILGRFSDDRKAVLDAIRTELRSHNCVPIVFDFTLPETLGYGGTVTLLARMAQYVIADLTDASEIRSELMQIVPNLPRLPVAPLLLAGHAEYATFPTDVKPYPWVLPVYEYTSREHLIETLEAAVIEPAKEKRRELTHA